MNKISGLFNVNVMYHQHRILGLSIGNCTQNCFGNIFPLNLFKMLKLHSLLHYSQLLKTLPSCLANKKVIAFSEFELEILKHHSYLSIYSLDFLFSPTNKLHPLWLKLRKIEWYFLHHHDEWGKEFSLASLYLYESS